MDEEGTETPAEPPAESPEPESQPTEPESQPTEPEPQPAEPAPDQTSQEVPSEISPTEEQPTTEAEPKPEEPQTEAEESQQPAVEEHPNAEKESKDSPDEVPTEKEEAKETPEESQPEPKPDQPEEEAQPEDAAPTQEETAIEEPDLKEETVQDAVEVGEKKSISEKKSSAHYKETSTESVERAKSTSLKEVASKENRRSRAFSRSNKILGSIISIKRLSVYGDYYDRSKGARFMNTYKLDSDNAFNSDKVQKILENVMLEALENLTYDPEKCPKQAKWASSAIRAKVKELQFDRYKLVCLVTIGEKTSQDVLVTCRFLWDVDRDRYAFYSLENTYVYGIAMCFGIYYE